MLQVYDLEKRFGQVDALNGVTLAVSRGETVVVMGPSGCGKSTLLRCVNRLVEPDDGEIWFEGAPVRDMDGAGLLAYRRRVGFVFQHFNLVARLSVLDNTALGLVMAGVSKQEARQAAARALSQVGIGKDLHARRPAELSGGQRQRVGIARALAGQPDLMLWDEPTASLDPILVQEVLAVMENVAASTGAGMLIVTHELSFALRLADRLVLMDQGRIVEDGDPRTLISSPVSEVGQRYQQLWQARHLIPGIETTRRVRPTPVASAGTFAEAQKRVAAGQWRHVPAMRVGKKGTL